MKKAKLKISTYVIDDALLSDAAENTISIPCESDTEFCMQPDGWDENTSIPATLDNKPVLLYRHYYDKKKHHWVMRIV